MSAENTCRGELRLEVKKTRHGKILSFADDDAPPGLRGMTDVERKAHDYIKKIVEEFDTEAVDPGRVGTVYVECGTDFEVEWSSDAARAAAGGGHSGE